MAATQKEYLDTSEACKYLGVSRTTLNVYVREGRLQQYEQQAPKKVLYKREELDALKEIRPRD